MRVRRGRHNNLGTSPGRQSVGVIAIGPDGDSSDQESHGWLATTIDLTLFNLVHGFEEYGPPPIGALSGRQSDISTSRSRPSPSTIIRARPPLSGDPTSGAR